MEKTNALAMRRNLGQVLRRLERGGAPVLVERNRQAAAVLISMRDYRERFVDRAAAEERQQLVEEILALRTVARRSRRKNVDLVREVRGSLP